MLAENSPLSDTNGFRKDVLAGAKDLHVSVLHWPGGDFSSDYDRAGSATKDKQFAGPMEIFEVNGPDIKSQNDFGVTVAALAPAYANKHKAKALVWTRR